ncbi:reductase [Bibersteinia trehalosi USDA-ARS-USMARC-188]|uniref:Reductase n=3 Tax=Bibersteinia trehalosi TaxID=47735 RepID=A0A4V7IAW2_BIBTR|nr:reductase [Bibersteinia trehalosi USDA-ARS-USMARC-192]AHG82136.1 reductase [Bibersteinia trehalosi USDA-ARS-USMARC-188]AHG84445.1 reductase [Bibersteinia trehalosi USDA-ARS-USMARC-189]
MQGEYGEKMIIHILDDEESILDAMSFLLAPLGIEIQTWQSSVDFLAQADLHQQGVLLLDIRMPLPDGQQVHQQLREVQSTLAVVIMTAHGDVPMAVAELKKGAVDFLQKPASFEQLKQAITQVKTVSEQAVKIREISQNYAKLTEKERNLVPLIMQGFTNKQIADHLAISVRTVEVHRANVMEKMQAESLAELVQKLGLLPTP